MSIVVAYKDKDRVLVGCDTRMSKGDDYSDGYEERPKAVLLKKNIIVGFVGNGTLLDRVVYRLSDYITEKTTRAEIITNLIPNLLKDLDDGTTAFTDGLMDGDLLIAIDDRAYIISNNFDVREIITYDAIGSAEIPAKSCLYSIKDYDLTPEERVAKAILCASKFNRSISSEIYIGDTKGNSFKKYDICSFNIG